MWGLKPPPPSVTIPPSSSVTVRLLPSRSRFLPRQAFPSHSEADRLFSYLHCFCLSVNPLSSLRRQAGNPEKPPCFPPAKKSESAYNQEEEKKAVSGRRHDVVQCGQRGFCFDGVFFARVKARLGSWLKGKQKSRSRPQRGQRWRLP